MTKAERQAAILADHSRAAFRGDKYLYRVYGSYSQEKQEAFDRCREIQYRFDGYDGAIVRHSGWRFSYGFYYDTVSDETGEVLSKRFCYITYAGKISTDFETWEVESYV